MTLRTSLRALAGRLFVIVAVLLAFTPGWNDVRSTPVATPSTAMSSSYLNLRAAPMPTSRIFMIVPPQAALTVTGEAKSGYVPVVYGERDGWVDTGLIQVDSRPAAVAASTFDESALLPAGSATLIESVNLRAGPGIDHDAVVVIDAGTEVEATGEISGAYEKVRFGDSEGWVRSVYVDRGPEPEDDERRQAEIMAVAAEAGRPLVMSGAQVVSDAEIVLRSGPGSDQEKLAVVPINSDLTLTGKMEDGFLEAQFGDKTGWVAAGYLSQKQIPTDSPPNVPVLMYHSIQETGAEYQVTAAQLEEQLAWLAENGYESITSAELVAWMVYGIPLPEKPVMITIDDGNASDWVFLELLEQYGFEGVFSLPNYAQLTAGQIRTLDRAGEVCGHTVSHPNLSTMSYDEQLYEIAENKAFLESVLGNEITCFSYPFGAFDELTPYIVIEAGYLMAFDVAGGPQPLDRSMDRWHVYRINVNGYGTLDDFIASLSY